MQATIAATEARMRAKLEAASEGSAPVLEKDAPKSGKAAAVVAKAPPPVPAKLPTQSPRAATTSSTSAPAKGGDLTALGAFVGA